MEQTQGHEPSSPSPAPQKWGLALLGLVPTVAAVLLTTLGPIVSGDFWWHLRTGKWILNEGRLPIIDPFSHTAGDTPWVLQEYGSQIIYAVVHGLTGFGGLKLFATLLSLALLAVVWRRARKTFERPWAALFTCLFALLFALKWELRPHLFSILIFFWLENNLFRHKGALSMSCAETPDRRRCLELFVLSMVWVQLHAEALFAPILVLAVLTGAAISNARGHSSGRHTLAWVGMFLCALLGTMASPLFLEPHHYALFGRGVPQDFIEEWFRPWVLPGDPRFAPLTIPLFATYCATLLIGGLFTLRTLVHKLGRNKNQNEISWERLAFLAGCLLFALSARRFFWLAWFPLFDAAVLSLRGRANLAALSKAPALGAALFGILLFPTHYPQSAARSIVAGQAGSLVDPALFPAHAANFAADAGLEGNLYNPYEWGGYLGWILRDAAPVFIDARTVLFEDVILERWQAERDGAYRAQVFQNRNVDLVIFKHFVDHGAGTTPWSPNSADGKMWLRAWTDSVTVVWVRRGSKNADRAIKHWKASGVIMDPVDGITEAALNMVRPKDMEKLAILPGEVLEKLRHAESLAGSYGSDKPQFEILERALFWRQMRMKRNVREELRALVRLLRGSYIPDSEKLVAQIEGGLASGDREDLANIVSELQAHFYRLYRQEMLGGE